MLTGSIVLYNNDERILTQAVKSFLDTPLKKRLFLIDNSSSDKLRKFYISDEITYIHIGKNIGFGKAHNLVTKELKNVSEYHLILNPDAYFSKEVLPNLIEQMCKDESMGLIAPKILYPNGNLQNSIRRFPKIQDFFLRRIPLLNRFFKREFNKVNYLNISKHRSTEVEALSGCFQLFKTKVFLKVNGFDPRYFMYMEDIDICRKVKQMGYKVFYSPNVAVYHHSEYGSKKKINLLLVHLSSIIKYFYKWRFRGH